MGINFEPHFFFNFPKISVLWNSSAFGWTEDEKWTRWHEMTWTQVTERQNPWCNVAIPIHAMAKASVGWQDVCEIGFWRERRIGVRCCCCCCWCCWCWCCCCCCWCCCCCCWCCWCWCWCWCCCCCCCCCQLRWSCVWIMIKIKGCKKESQFAKVTLLVKKYHVDR